MPSFDVTSKCFLHLSRTSTHTHHATYELNVSWGSFHYLVHISVVCLRCQVPYNLMPALRYFWNIFSALSTSKRKWLKLLSLVLEEKVWNPILNSGTFWPQSTHSLVCLDCRTDLLFRGSYITPSSIDSRSHHLPITPPISTINSHPSKSPAPLQP